MKLCSKDVMKMLKDPKNCVVLVLVLIVLVVGVVYLLKMRREGFQVTTTGNEGTEVMEDTEVTEVMEGTEVMEDTEVMEGPGVMEDTEGTEVMGGPGDMGGNGPPETAEVPETTFNCDGCTSACHTQETATRCLDNGCWSASQ